MEQKIKPHLWIGTELFWPEETSTSYIMTKVANKLTEKYSVSVVCAAPAYDKTSIIGNNFSLDDNVIVKRISSTSTDKNKIGSRVKRFAEISAKMFFFFLKNLKRGQTLLTVTNPAPFVVFCAFLKIVKKSRWVLLVHDVFPENAFAAGIIKEKNSSKYRVLKSIFDWSYGQADEIIVLGRDMKEVVEKKIYSRKQPSPIHIVENWGDTENIFPENRKSSETIVIQYAGNVGRVQGLHRLLEVIKKVQNPYIRIEIWGEGAVKQELMDFVAANNLPVEFKRSYSRSEQREILNSCDLALVTLAKDMYGLGVPSKTYNIFSAGKPVLYIGPRNSEIDILLRETGAGFSFSPEDSSLEEFFENLHPMMFEELAEKGLLARKLALRNYTEDVILNKFLQII